ACSSNTPCAPRRDKGSHTSSTPHIMTGTWKGSLRSRAVLTSFSSRRRFSMKLQILPHRGNILPHVKPVTSQSEQALPDLSHSTSRPATASRSTGFEARRRKPSAAQTSHWCNEKRWNLDFVVHGFRTARPLQWSGEGRTASDGARHTRSRPLRRCSCRQSQVIGLPVGGLCRMVCGRDCLSLRRGPWRRRDTAGPYS